ncbi:BLUF domain-containing protein [Mucilaginibacter achroorhodeus]|uniref:BLUF domain-containing protein n=1 Tax=Mucilaginibacter achroorhodeus TaxID=2599294 RepID=A0A563U764_9SPHI|nr:MULTISPECIES: BLUF domain-containing protein [Mucilaginibacter]QXV65038.1 BLUF domain-containing protein [Mucilaginibacter sp. 21P]TWR27186.1 BLUF domain-containing protein [Mucilaginibacter achroorhodeus]
MLYTVYISAAATLLTTNELKDLLVKSQLRNSDFGITGLLLYNNGVFMGVIEGNRQYVTKLFDNIENDTNNTAVIKLAEQPITERQFDTWTMSFKTNGPDGLKNIQGYVQPHQICLPVNIDRRVAELVETFFTCDK